MFAIAIGTVLFPSLSRFAAGADMERFRETVSNGVRQIFFVSLPFVCWYVFMPEAIVRLIYQHGRFGAADTHDVAGALAFFSLGMLFANGAIMFNRAFQSLQRPWFPLYMAVGNLALNVVLAAAPVAPSRGARHHARHGHRIDLQLRRPDAADASSAGRRRRARHHHSPAAHARLRRGPDGGKCGSVARPARLRGPWPDALALAVIGSTALGGVVYLASARLLRVEELAVVSSLLRRGRRGQGAPGAAA